MWKAFNEMEAMGWIDSRRPRMISVQTEGCAPIVKAFNEKKKESEFWPDARTIASGLRVPKAFADHLILDAIYASRGIACAVSDDAIVAAVKEVAAGDGLFLCPEGAATVVALKDLLKKQFIKPSDVVVLFNTAAGNKYPEVVPD